MTGVDLQRRTAGCAWGRIDSSRLEREGTADNFAIDDEATRVTFGVQREIIAGWLAGAAASWISHDQDTPDLNSVATGDAYQIAGSLKRPWENNLLAGSMVVGAAEYSTRREAGILTPFVAEAEVDVTFVTAQLRAARLFSMDRLYLRPSVDLSMTHVDVDGFAETGGGALGFVSEGTSQTVWAVSPSVEVGHDYRTASGAIVRPWVQLGANWRPGAELDVSARLSGSPAASAPIRAASPMDEASATLGVGVDLVREGPYSFSAGYEGEFGDEYRRRAFRLKATFSF